MRKCVTYLRLTACVSNKIVFISHDHQTEISMIKAFQNLISHRSTILKTENSTYLEAWFL